MEVRIGELLVDAGVLTDRQVHDILRHQQRSGEPFGALSERLFGIDPTLVEHAWALQYAQITRPVDPRSEAIDEQVLALVTRRQAWQFRVLPIRFDGSELMLATIRPFLRRALGFATRVMGAPTYLVLAEPPALGEALCRWYPLPGMTPQCVVDSGMDRLLALAGGGDPSC